MPGMEDVFPIGGAKRLPLVTGIVIVRGVINFLFLLKPLTTGLECTPIPPSASILIGLVFRLSNSLPKFFHHRNSQVDSLSERRGLFACLLEPFQPAVEMPRHEVFPVSIRKRF